MFSQNKIQKADVIAVYAVIATITYAWSTLQFFWNLPSWFYFSSFAEVSTLFVYMLAVNFIESLLIIFFILALFIPLPAALITNQLIVKGALLTLSSLGFLIVRNIYFPAKALAELTPQAWILIAAIALTIIIAPLYKFPAFCKAVENLADRFIIFLYIIIPISALSLSVVIFRNLF